MKRCATLLLFYGLICCTSSLISHGKVASSKPVVLEDYDSTILPDRSVCGKIKETPKIYGGKAVHMGEFPWAVALEYAPRSTNEGPSTLCAGSLITTRFVLTSANCVNNTYRIPSNAILGEWKFGTDPDCVGTTDCADTIVKVKIQDIIIHDYYSRRTRENDIALIRLEKDVSYTEFISPVCLPPKNLPFPQEGEFVTVAGWGLTETGGVSDILLKVDLPITSREECGKKINKVIFENNFCAGGEAGKDSCQGDSGSFAIRTYEDDNNPDRWYQYGIVSFGAGCGIVGRSGIYTNVHKYMDWIVATIRKSSAL